ncbi:MAG: hypothetical protein FJW37_04550, partial [Acidobacteria bacterium]|nr:hypothetical protein [Acidobacteriota bacterium]
MLTALAATTLDDSMTGGLEPRQSAVLLLVYLALVGGAQGLVGVVLGRRDGKQPIRLALFQAALAFLFLLPVLTEPLTRAAAAVSYPEGALLLWGVRNIGLGAAAFSRWEVGLRLGAFASACQVIFAFTLGGAGAAPGLTAAYVCTLALWLCGYAAARTGNGLGAKRLHYFGSGA